VQGVVLAYDADRWFPAADDAALERSGTWSSGDRTIAGVTTAVGGTGLTRPLNLALPGKASGAAEAGNNDALRLLTARSPFSWVKEPVAAERFSWHTRTPGDACLDQRMQGRSASGAVKDNRGDDDRNMLIFR
jgi:hypothetical protein